MVQNGPNSAAPNIASSATPKSAQKAYEVKNFHEFTEVPNDEGNKRISLVSIVSKKNKTKDWALVQNAASAGDKVELGLFR